jgi:DNA-binding response OmpR family regulator
MTEWLKILLEQRRLRGQDRPHRHAGEELFKSWGPDAVVTDMVLPDMDGIDLVRSLDSSIRSRRSL